MDAAQKSITITLKAPKNGTLDDILPFLQPGAHVAAGRGLAVIESVESKQVNCASERRKVHA